MTLEEARMRVRRIWDVVDDGEEAHIREDDLRRDVLLYLSEVAPAELSELARIALSTEEIEFSRWYA